MKARDQRIPEKTGQGITTVYVVSDRSVPYFIGEPFSVTIPARQPVGSDIIGVGAGDDRLTVSILLNAYLSLYRLPIFVL